MAEHASDDRTEELFAEERAEGPENVEPPPGEGSPAHGGAKTTAKPRRRRAHPAAEYFGKVPEDATRWGICRLRHPDDEQGERLSFQTDDGAVLRDWPLEELSTETVRARWGGGLFKVYWWRETGRGGLGFITRGKLVEFRETAAAAPSAAAAPPPVVTPAASGGLPPAFHDAMTMLGVVEQMSSSKLAQLAQLSQLVGGNRQDAGSLELVREMMRQNQETTARMLEQQAEQTRALVSAFRAALEGDEFEEESSALVPAAAAVAAPMFKPGESITDTMKASFLNWAAQNPGEALSLAKEALSFLGKLAPSAPPRAPAAAVHVVRRAAPTMPAPPSVQPAPVAPPAPPSSPSVASAPVEEPAEAAAAS